MLPSIHCPLCQRSLGKVHSDGSGEMECVSCRKTFSILYGKLSGWQSRREAMLYLTPHLPSIFKRHYELRITTPGRVLKRCAFSMPGQRDRLPVHPGDRVSIIYCRWGDGIRQLVGITNHTSGKNLRLPRTIPSLPFWFATYGSLCAGVILAAFFNGIGMAVMPWAAIALVLGARGADTVQLTTPLLRPHVPLESRLLAEQRLFDQKLYLEQRVEALRAENQSHQDWMRQLRSLRGKMLQVSASLYATRVHRIENAVRLLQQRMQHNNVLTEKYHQTIKLIEIELEAAYVDSHLVELEPFKADLFRRLAELKAIEESQRNLWLQLEANEEVRRLSFEG